MRTRIALLGALVACAGLAVALVGSSASGASQRPAATARALGGSAPAKSVGSFAPPAACSPCLYYSGDFNAGDPNANGLANEQDAIVSDSRQYSPVTPNNEWLVSGLFTNNLSGLVPTSMVWEIRTGVSSGNGGAVYASGSGAGSQTATGRSAFGYNEYTDFVALSPSVILHAGVTYWISVVPVCTACVERSFESNALPAGSAANRLGPPDVLNQSYWNSSFFGENFQNSNSGGVFPLFSFGIKGTPATTLTVTKHLISNPSDPGKFNLRVDGTTYAANVGNGGTTGYVVVTAGSHTVSETAGVGTNLGNYTPRIECSDGSAGYGTSLSGVQVAQNTQVSCVITNTRKLFHP